jgi:hypothetical protein
MTKPVLTILFVLAINCCMGQYYAVNDPDGFVNVREKASITSAALYQLPNEAIVYVSYTEDEDVTNNWLHVDFYVKKTSSKKNTEDYTPEIMKGLTLHSGYIYKSKLTAIEKLTPLKNKQLTKGYVCFNDSVTIKVSVATFIPAKHTLQYSKQYENVLDKIDRLPMIGTDGDKPRKEITTITFSLNNIQVSIPATAYKNLFNPSQQGDAYIDKNGTIYLVMYNSDAAGSYSCIFVFKNGRFTQRLVFGGDC